MDSRGPKCCARRPRRTRSGAAPAGPPGRRGFRHRHGRRCRDHVRRGSGHRAARGRRPRAVDQEPIWSTWYVTLYRGAAVDGADVATHPPPLRPASPGSESEVVAERRVSCRSMRMQPTSTRNALRHPQSDPPPIWPWPTRPACQSPSCTALRPTLALGVTSTLAMIGGTADGVRRIAGSVPREWRRCLKTHAWRSNSSRPTPPPPPRRLVSRCATTQAMSPYADGLVEIGR